MLIEIVGQWQALVEATTEGKKFNEHAKYCAARCSRCSHLADDVQLLQFLIGSLLSKLRLLSHLPDELVVGLNLPVQLFCLL